MKYLFNIALIVLSVFLYSFAHAGSHSVGIAYVPAAGGACSTPSTGDELNEGFIGTGYENVGWSETIGANGTVDEDHTLSGTPPAGSCSEGLLTSVTTSGGVTYARYDLGAGKTPTVDIYIEFRIVSATLPEDYDAYIIIAWGELSSIGSRDGSIQLFKKNDGNIAIYESVDGNTQVAVIDSDWHTIQLHIDATASNSYSKYDSESTIGFIAGGNDVQYIFLGPSSLLDSDEASEIEWGRVWVDTP